MKCVCFSYQTKTNLIPYWSNTTCLLNDVLNFILIFRFNGGPFELSTSTFNNILPSAIELAIFENMVGGFGISILSCVQAEIHAFPVRQRPFWIFDFRLRWTPFSLVPLSWPSSKIWKVPFEFWFYHVCKLRNMHFRFNGGRVRFPIPFSRAVLELVPLSCLISKMWEQPLKFCCYHEHKLADTHVISYLLPVNGRHLWFTT